MYNANYWGLGFKIFELKLLCKYDKYEDQLWR